jgi:hypothetical protein
MPQEQVQPYEPLPTDYRYRVTLFSADDVVPPEVPGQQVGMTTCGTRELADQSIEVAAARTDLGRITLEERLFNDVDGRKNEWHVIHTWTRGSDSWQHQ